MSYAFSPALITSFTKTFQPETVKPTRKMVPHKIKVNGAFIKLNSGKSVWKCLGHAKSALLNHFESTMHGKTKWEPVWEKYGISKAPCGYRYAVPGITKPLDSTEVYHLFLEELIASKIVEFVPSP